MGSPTLSRLNSCVYYCVHNGRWCRAGLVVFLCIARLRDHVFHALRSRAGPMASHTSGHCSPRAEMAASRSKKNVLDINQRLLDDCHGDVRLPQVLHFSKGPEDSPRKATFRIADALLSGMLERFCASLPSTAKWWMFEKTLAPSTALLHVCGVADPLARH